MKKTKSKKVSKAAVTLYAIATVMLGITIYYAYTCCAYVASIVEEGFVISENLTDTINYYLSTLTPYVFYTVCLVAIGYMLQQIKKISLLQSVNVEEREVEVEEIVDEDESYNTLINELKAQ